MAAKGIYQFRDKSLSQEEALTREQAKPAGSQGTRTFARDLRRFFILTRLLARDLDGNLRHTPMGARLLASDDPNAEAARQVWRTALSNMAIGEGNEESHPYELLLRLVGDRPGIDARRLALALEAKNDSEEEYNRILSLADSRDWESLLTELEVSEHQARNAIKILPALARQLGDLHEERGTYYPTMRPARRGRPRSRSRRSARLGQASRPSYRRHRRVALNEIARSPETPSTREPREEDYASPRETEARRRERLRRHQQLVRDFAAQLAMAGYELQEDPFDILATHASVSSILTEAKTLEESGSDEPVQVRASIGQLSYYEYLEVPPDAMSHSLIKVALFEQPISEPHITLLESLNIIVVWREERDFVLPAWSKAQMARLNLFQ